MSLAVLRAAPEKVFLVLCQNLHRFEGVVIFADALNERGLDPFLPLDKSNMSFWSCVK